MIEQHDSTTPDGGWFAPATPPNPAGDTPIGDELAAQAAPQPAEQSVGQSAGQSADEPDLAEEIRERAEQALHPQNYAGAVMTRLRDDPNTWAQSPAFRSPLPLDVLIAYSTLALVKGADTTPADVHCAWAASIVAQYPGHRDLVAYVDLPADVQARYDPLVRAIHRAVGGPAPSARFEVYPDRAAPVLCYRWRLRADDGAVVAESPWAYIDAQTARDGAEKARAATHAPVGIDEYGEDQELAEDGLPDPEPVLNNPSAGSPHVAFAPRTQPADDHVCDLQLYFERAEDVPDTQTCRCGIVWDRLLGADGIARLYQQQQVSV